MKKIKAFVYSLVMAAIISGLVYAPVPVFSASTGSQIEFLLNQIRSSAGSLAGGKVYFYEAGTSTNKTVYLDINLNSPAANPYTLDANGTAQLYGDGTYRIVIRNTDNVVVYDRDNVRYEDFATLLITGDMIDNNTLNLNNFPSDLRPVRNVDALPTCGLSTYTEGSVVYLTTDYKLYRCAVDNVWKSFVDNTDIVGTFDNSYLAAGSVIAGKIAAGAINASSLIADNIITNDMIVGGIAAAKIAAGYITAENTESGTFQQSYTAPGDDNTTPGAGLKITTGKIEAYGGDQTFGGTIISSDGNYLLAVGKRLTAAGTNKRYPINNATNFSTDGVISFYEWTTQWVLRMALGDSSPIGSPFMIYVPIDNTMTVSGIYSIINSLNYEAIFGTNNADGGTAIVGYAVSGYGARFEGNGKGPIRLAPSAGPAPTHSALKGTFWLDNTAVVYVNTDGGTTWQKVGAQ